MVRPTAALGTFGGMRGSRPPMISARNFGLPELLRSLLHRDRVCGSSRQREIIYPHAPALAFMHHIEPPRVFAPRAGSTALLLTDFSNGHSILLFVYETLVGTPRRIQSSTSLG